MPLYISLAFPTEQQREMARLLSDGEDEPLRYTCFFQIFRFKVYVKISPFAKGYTTKLVINHAFFIFRELEDTVESG